MDMPTFPIQDQLMIYHRAVCEALELPYTDFSPPQVVVEIRSLMARPSAGFAPPLKAMLAERDTICSYLHSAADRAGKAANESHPWDAAATLRNVAIQVYNGAHLLHVTLQDGEAGAATEEPVVKGNSMSISDKPSGIDG